MRGEGEVKIWWVGKSSTTITALITALTLTNQILNIRIRPLLTMLSQLFCETHSKLPTTLFIS